MNLIDDLIEHGVARSRRHLSILLGHAPNYISETKGLRAEDLVHLRLHLIERGGPAALIGRTETLLLEPWAR